MFFLSSFSFSLHFMNFTDPVWQGHCYGRNTEEWTNVEEENVVSGVRKPCGPGEWIRKYDFREFDISMLTIKVDK